LPTLVFSVPQSPTSPGLARRRVRELVDEPTLGDAANSVALVTSELVTNAVLHGDEPIRVSLAWDGSCFRIEVSDGDPRADRVRPRPVSERETSGHGLHIVAAVAQNFGVRRTNRGKVAWAEIAVDRGV
jgi:anti-sigma regulatory factor (Ser/Thr protein kinase)